MNKEQKRLYLASKENIKQAIIKVETELKRLKKELKAINNKLNEIKKS